MHILALFFFFISAEFDRTLGIFFSMSGFDIGIMYNKHNTAGTWIPNIWTPETFESQTNLNLVFKWYRIQMPGSRQSFIWILDRFSNGWSILGCHFALSIWIQVRFQMVTILTTIYSSPDQFVRYSNGVVRCPVPTKIDHLNTRLVRYSDPHCSWTIFWDFTPWVFQLEQLELLCDESSCCHFQPLQSPLPEICKNAKFKFVWSQCNLSN
jgi:hypothetical protein